MQAKIQPRIAAAKAQGPAPLCLFPPVPSQLLLDCKHAAGNVRAHSINCKDGMPQTSPWDDACWSPPCQKGDLPAPTEFCSNQGQQGRPPSHPQRIQISRRQIFYAGGVAALLPTAAAASAQTYTPQGPQQAAPQPGLSREACLEKYAQYLTAPDYWQEGPLNAVRLPIKLSHVLTSCYSSGFAGTSCQVKFDVFYPKGGATLGLGPPYPLALITSGFLVSSEAYKSYAQRLASWGYAVLLYDKQETMSEILDDVTSVAALRQCIDLAASDPLIKRVADPSRVYLVGHSRGGKISALAALEDPRVVALCLLDPVDNTVYAPLAPGFPSAVAALQGSPSPDGSTSSGSSSDSNKSRSRNGQVVSSSSNSSSSRNNCAEGLGGEGWLVGEGKTREGGAGRVSGMGSTSIDGGRTGVSACASLPVSFPVAVVGSGIGGDCAPSDANYRQFFNATHGPTWEVSIKNAGHFQYLDVTSPLQSYLCPAGSAPDDEVRHIACGVMVAWAELCLRHKGRDVLRGTPLADVQVGNSTAPFVSSASATARAPSAPSSGPQQGAGVPGDGSGFVDRMMWGKDGPPGLASFKGAAGASGPNGGSQGPGESSSGSSHGSSSAGGSRQIYPYACMQGQGGEAAAANSPRSSPGSAFPWDVPGLRREAQDTQSNREGAQSKDAGSLSPQGRLLSFDPSLPESLDAALRKQGLRGSDVATRYKAFGGEM